MNFEKNSWANTMLRENLKREIDTLNESQLAKIAEFVVAIKAYTQQWVKKPLFWQRATPSERSQDFRRWVAGLSKTGVSLSDDAFDRESIYE